MLRSFLSELRPSKISAMGTVARKRGRAESESGAKAPVKRRQPAEDSDIDSDDVGSVGGDEVNVDVPEASSSEDSTPDNETAEERRLRLARAYLRHIGVSEDAADASGSDSEDDRANEMLRADAMKSAGKAVTYIADSFAERISKATISKGKGHALPPTCVAMAAEGETAVSGGKDSRIIVWDVATGKKTFTFKPTVEKRHKRNPSLADGHIGNVLTVAMSDDAALAVSGGQDGLIRVWDTRAGKLVESLRGHRGPVHGLAFRENSRQLFSASKDRTVKIWDMNDMAYVETLFGHGAEVNSIDSLAQERALSCGRDGTLRLYKVVEGSQLVFRRALTVSIDVVAMLSEQRFVSGGDDGAVCLWQQSKKKPTAVIEKAHGAGLGCESWISSVAAFRNTDLVMSGAGDGNLRFWKCEDVPKLVSAGRLDLGPGFVNGIATATRHGVMAVAIGTEHRLGRWGRVGGAKNTIQFVSPPSE